MQQPVELPDRIQIGPVIDEGHTLGSVSDKMSGIVLKRKTTIGWVLGFLIVFGIGWGFFDGNNMPILAQIVRPHLRATGYGIMNFVSISCGGLADLAFGVLRDRDVATSRIFTVFASAAVVSVVLVLLIRPRPELAAQEQPP